MQIKLEFLGAAQNITGSWHFLYANGIGLLVDSTLKEARQKERFYKSTTGRRRLRKLISRLFADVNH